MCTSLHRPCHSVSCVLAVCLSCCMYRRVVYVALVHVIHISVWALCAKFLAALTIWLPSFKVCSRVDFVEESQRCAPVRRVCAVRTWGACAPCRLRVIWESSNFVKHNKKKKSTPLRGAGSPCEILAQNSTRGAMFQLYLPLETIDPRRVGKKNPRHLRNSTDSSTCNVREFRAKNIIQ